MKDKKESICLIELGKNSLDNDYRIYSDGTIHHKWDNNIYSYNHEEWLEAKEIGDDLRNLLLAKTPDENKALVKKILYGT